MRCLLSSQIQLAAATGDYGQSDADLAEFAALYDKPLRQATALAVADAMLQTRLDKQLALLQSALSFLNWPLDRQTAFRNVIQNSVKRLPQVADLMVLRGLLSLERGETTAARTLLRHPSRALGSG